MAYDRFSSSISKKTFFNRQYANFLIFRIEYLSLTHGQHLYLLLVKRFSIGSRLGYAPLLACCFVAEDLAIFFWKTLIEKLFSQNRFFSLLFFLSISSMLLYVFFFALFNMILMRQCLYPYGAIHL